MSNFSKKAFSIIAVLALIFTQLASAQYRVASPTLNPLLAEWDDQVMRNWWRNVNHYTIWGPFVHAFCSLKLHEW